MMPILTTLIYCLQNGQVLQLAIPQADTVFFPRVTDQNQPFYHAKYTYDADLELAKVQEHPT